METATTAALRADYLVTDLFAAGEVRGAYTHEDRMVLGGAMPTSSGLRIPAWEAPGTESHLQRRWLGIVCLAPGEVLVDGVQYSLGYLDGLYVGRGAEVTFAGQDACFYFVSAPADVAYPCVHQTLGWVEPLELGDPSEGSVRSLYRYVWGGGGNPSCQLQFGVTVLAQGSVWNTMPPHLHDRRSEIYLYLLDDPSGKVMHLMGRPGATR